MQKLNDAVIPRIAITIGDAAGIGPEIVLKALKNESIFQICRPILIGDRKIIESTSSALRSGLRFREFSEEISDEIDIVDLNNLGDGVVAGQESAVTGKASAEYIEAAVRLWREGKVDAISTAPISKNSLKLGGYKYPGHTEFLAELTGTKQFAMSFFAEKLRVVLLSTHVSLLDAIDLVKKDALVKLIGFSNNQISKLIGREAKIAVAGLNPHASEGGMFGREEEIEITPAITECREHGIDVSGPFSPDTIFLRGFRGEFDLVVACYHDQATIAVKSLSFGSSVNVTLGLPLIRTSVDHGTAFDIAGKFIAEESSMQAAIKLAAELTHKSNNA